jgi:hypothetical protein
MLLLLMEGRQGAEALGAQVGKSAGAVGRIPHSAKRELAQRLSHDRLAP